MKFFLLHAIIAFLQPAKF